MRCGAGPGAPSLFPLSLREPVDARELPPREGRALFLRPGDLVAGDLGGIATVWARSGGATVRDWERCCWWWSEVEVTGGPRRVQSASEVASLTVTEMRNRLHGSRSESRRHLNRTVSIGTGVCVRASRGRTCFVLLSYPNRGGWHGGRQELGPPNKSDGATRFATHLI